MTSGPEADLGVVVVNYNAGERLLRCLRSAAAAVGDARLETVVVDNASADGSARRVAEGVPGSA